MWVWDVSGVLHAQRTGTLPLLQWLAESQHPDHGAPDGVQQELSRLLGSRPVWPLRLEQTAPTGRQAELRVRLTRMTPKPTDADVLALAEQLGGVAVVDSRYARRIGRQEGIATKGLLSVVLGALDAGLLTPARAQMTVEVLAADGARFPHLATKDLLAWQRLPL